jgi:hypothetical protein
MEVFTMVARARTMAKKKGGGELKLTAVKIERDIASMAKMIATRQGLPVATYLSRGLRAMVERDWARMVRQANEGGAE